MHNSSCICIIQFEMGSCCLCSDTTKQESYAMVNKLGTRTSRCILEESCHTICFTEHTEASNIVNCVCIGLLLHDTDCICSIFGESGGLGESRTFPQAINWMVSVGYKQRAYYSWGAVLQRHWKQRLWICRSFVKSFLQGFLPGLALKLFLYFLPGILMIMSKIEGHVAFSVLERRTAAKYYYFMLVNVFLGSIVAGTAFEQLHAFLNQSATQ